MKILIQLVLCGSLSAQTLVLDPSTLKFVPIPVQPPTTSGITLKSTDPFTNKQTTIGSSAILNINPGRGIFPIMSTDGKELSLQFEIDTAVIPAGPPGPPGPPGVGVPGPPGAPGKDAPQLPPSQVLPPAGANGLVLTTKSGVWVPSLPSGIPFFAGATPQPDGSWTCGPSKDLQAGYPALRLNPWGMIIVVDRQEQHATGASTDDWKYPPAVNSDGLAVIVPNAAWKQTAVVVCHYALQ